MVLSHPLIGFLTFLGETKHLVKSVTDCRDVLSRSLNVEYSTIFIMKNNITRNSILPPKVIDAFKSSMLAGYSYLKSDAKLILLCGKRPDKSKPGGRDLIYQYSKKHLKNFQFFKAESFFDIFINHTNKDLLSLEDELANFSDCIIIILESESTFAELGAFAINDKIVKSLLVINDNGFKKSKSFIILGPIAKVNKKSQFKPVIHTNLKSILSIIPALKERLSKIESINNKKVEITTYDEFKSLDSKVKMLFILDLITIFHPITLKELIEILKYIYGDNDYEIDIELNMLEVLGLIKKLDLYFVRSTDDQQLFFKLVSFNEIKNRASIINHYHKYSRDKVSILRRKIGMEN